MNRFMSERGKQLKYKTIGLREWNIGDVYVYDYNLKTEKIYDNATISETINGYNQMGYWLSSVGLEGSKTIYYMTKTIE